jgi:hypothetical protein
LPHECGTETHVGSTPDFFGDSADRVEAPDGLSWVAVVVGLGGWVGVGDGNSGVEATEQLLTALRLRVKQERIEDAADVKQALREVLADGRR